MAGPKLWTPRKVAEATGLSISTITRCTLAGELPSVELDNGAGPARHTYRESAVRAWVRAQAIASPTQRRTFQLAEIRLRELAREPAATA